MQQGYVTLEVLNTCSLLIGSSSSSRPRPEAEAAVATHTALVPAGQEPEAAAAGSESVCAPPSPDFLSDPQLDHPGFYYAQFELVEERRLSAFGCRCRQGGGGEGGGRGGAWAAGAGGRGGERRGEGLEGV